MKLVRFIALIFAITASDGLEAQGLMPVDGKPDQERIAAARAKLYSRTGGIIEKEGSAKGRIVYFSCQNAMSIDCIREICLKQEQILGIRIEAEMIKQFMLGMASDIINERRATIGIFIVDDPTLSISLVAPDDRWAVINVSPLKDINNMSRTHDRISKQMWRVIAQVSGSGDCSLSNCVLKPISGVVGLDLIDAETFCPEPLQRISKHLSALGMSSPVRKTYRVACREGWAPAPTNDVQKAIWDEVNAEKERGPTKTRPIKFKGRRPPRP